MDSVILEVIPLVPFVVVEAILKEVEISYVGNVGCVKKAEVGETVQG